MRKTMRRWQMNAVGRESLKLAEVEAPQPARGEILVEVAAVSLNYRDKLMIETGMGLDLAFPFTPGSDLAGTVIAVGEGAGRFQVGDRVISTFSPGWIEGKPLGDARTAPYLALGGAYPGVLAEQVAFPQDWFVRAPASLDDAQASTLPCAGLTAWFALVERGKLCAGQTVLVEGTGGVAIFGLQIAKAHGAEVIVISGSAAKLERAKKLGADHAIDRSAEDWVEAVWRLTANRGADQILETVGGAHLEKALQAVAVHGHIAVIGVQDGFDISCSAGPLLLKSPTIQGISVGHRRALEDFVRAIDATGITPEIDARYAFADLHAALDHLDRGPFGKLVIDVARHA
ncbi:NAD(P)-dependent alcohol dehydrogenase [Xylophilus sp. GW821-FHT01B05]